jgi:hypothetical protein
LDNIAEIGKLERRRSMVASVKVIHAANDGVFDVPARTSVRLVRASLIDAFNIPATALALINGERAGEDHFLLDSDTLEFVNVVGRKGADLRTVEAVLADLDRLRDREEQARIEQEEEKQQRRDQRIARSRRKLDALLAQPPRHNTAELRRWLEAFIKIDSSNQPDLRARQRRVEERLKKLTSGTPPQMPTTKPQLSEADRLRQRALTSGDAAKAVEIAGRFHRFVKGLYVSQYAEIRYGRGGEQKKVWPRKYCRFPKVWKNAGVWIDYAAEQIVFENHKAEEKSRLPLPPMKQVTFDGLEDGDLWGVFRPFTPHVVERWGLDPSGVMVVRGYGQR